MKTKTLLIAAAMLLCFSAATYGQMIFSTSSTPITTVIKTGNAELVGNITFSATGGGATLSGTIYIQYSGGVNITSPFTAVANGIKICTNMNVGATAPTADAACAPGYGTQAGLGVDLAASAYTPGLLVVDVPVNMINAVTPMGAITVQGVRVQVNGTTLLNLEANISATGNLIAAGSTKVTVINSTQGDGIANTGTPTSYKSAPGFAFATATTQGSPAITANSGAIDFPTNTIVVKEGFLSAFSKGVGVRITVSAIPMKGVSFLFPGSASSYDSLGTTVINSNWARGTSAGPAGAAPATNYTIDSSLTKSSSLQVYYYVNTDTAAGPVNIENLEIPVTVVYTATGVTLPLSAATFSYTVSLAPVVGPYETDTSLATFGTPIGLVAPRFAAVELGPVTLATVSGASSALLVPYAYASLTPGDTNTAFAIINSSEDPGSTLLGFTAAKPQSGKMTFFFFSQNATMPMFSYTTAAGSPGAGLDATGSLVAGGTYTVFLDQLFPLAVAPSGSTVTSLGSNFVGYIIVVPTFANAHGMFVMGDLKNNATTFSSLMLILTNRTAPELGGF